MKIIVVILVVLVFYSCKSINSISMVDINLKEEIEDLEIDLSNEYKEELSR